MEDPPDHAAGDQVLIGLRKGNTIVGLAGDEFVYICDDLPNDA